MTPGPGVTGLQGPAAQTPVSLDFVTPLEGKEPADGGYQGNVDEDDRDLIPPEPVEIAIEPPEALQLDHDPGLGEILGTLEQGFGGVQVLSGPATYRTGRGRVIDLTASGRKDPTNRAAVTDLYLAVDQLKRHTCRRSKDGTERCTPDQPCGRHTQRERSTP